MAGLSDLRIRITADGTQATRAMQQVGTGMGRLRDESTRTERAMNALRGAFTGFAAQVAGALGLASIARSFVTTAVEMDKLNRGLVAVTGSSKAAAAEMAYITGIATKMGLKVQDAAQSYLGLSAAARGTALEGQGAKDIFEAISLAMGKLGKSSADTKGALFGLEQLLGQTTANLEDLRQITDRIPGGMGLAAKGMGMTVGVMKEMISSGEILVSDIVPGLARELNKLYDAAKNSKVAVQNGTQGITSAGARAVKQLLADGKLGYLAGVSRQRVNQALHVLESAGLLKVEYGGLKILDVEGLRNFGP